MPNITFSLPEEHWETPADQINQSGNPISCTEGRQDELQIMTPRIIGNPGENELRVLYWFQSTVKISKLPKPGLLVYPGSGLQLSFTDGAETTRGGTCYESRTLLPTIICVCTQNNKGSSKSQQLEQSQLAYGRHTALWNWKRTPPSDWLVSNDHEKLMQKVHNPKGGKKLNQGTKS